jgi:hypothetical protein
MWTPRGASRILPVMIDPSPQSTTPKARRATLYFVICFVIAAAAIVAWGVTRDDHHSSGRAPVVPTAPADRDPTVVYTLTGSAEGADITYSMGDGGTEQQQGVGVPLTNERWPVGGGSGT